MLEEVRATSESQLGRIRHLMHVIELASDDIRPAQGAPYRAGSTAIQFAANVIYIMMKEEIIEHVTTELESPTVFAPKTGSFRFCDD